MSHALLLLGSFTSRTSLFSVHFFTHLQDFVIEVIRLVGEDIVSSSTHGLQEQEGSRQIETGQKTTC